MNRRTSEYTFRFSPRMPLPGLAERELDRVLGQLKDLLTEKQFLSGSGVSGPTAFVQFRVEGDEEARRIVRALTAHGQPYPIFGTAVLTTGHGVNYRHLHFQQS